MPTAGAPRRPSAPYANPARAARPAAPPEWTGADRVAGCLLLLAAVIDLAEPKILSRWIQVEPDAKTYAEAGLTALLGLALLQSSEGARKVVLWLSALGLLGFTVMACVAVGLPAYGALLPLAACGIAAGIAVFGMLLGQPSMPRVIAFGLMFILSVVGNLVAEVWVIRGAEREIRATIAEWTAPEREFSDPAAGLRLKVPEGWVVLKPDNPLMNHPGAKIALGHAGVGAVAAILQPEGEAYISLDNYLDRVLTLLRERYEDIQQESRSDVAIGKAIGRRMSMTWTIEGHRLEGFVTGWKDGPRYFSFLGFTTGGHGEEAEASFRGLEKALVFDAPVDTRVKETVARVTAACPLLSAAAVESMMRSMPADASADLYFRKGYEWAGRGAPELGPEVGREMGAITSALFRSLSASDRDRLGSYLERLRTGQATTPAQDRAMNEVMKRAILALPAKSQEDLRRLTERAIEVGRLLSSASAQG
jgi:hypothetical protein